MSGNLQSYLGVYNQAMSLRAYRHQVLASNIANADTPHYKARDFDFKATFAKAMGERDPNALPLVLTHERHLDGSRNGLEDGIPLLYRTEFQSAVDGNTVDMNVERGEIADNALQYQIISQFLSDKIKGMRTAISGNQG